MFTNTFIKNVKVGKNGQITIPQNIREVLGVSSGDGITFVVENGSVRLINSVVYAMQMLQTQVMGEAADCERLLDNVLAVGCISGNQPRRPERWLFILLHQLSKRIHISGDHLSYDSFFIQDRPPFFFELYYRETFRGQKVHYMALSDFHIFCYNRIIQQTAFQTAGTKFILEYGGIKNGREITGIQPDMGSNR